MASASASSSLVRPLQFLPVGKTNSCRSPPPPPQPPPPRAVVCCSHKTRHHLHMKISSQTLFHLPLCPTPFALRRLAYSSSSSVATAVYRSSGAEEAEEAGSGEEQSQLSSGSRSRSPPEAAAAGGRLYVGNLSYSMTPSQLTDIFSEAGTVLSVEVVYDRVTDRSRGFAFVTMATVDEATQAIRMFDGSQVGGRTVKVNFPEVPRGGEREVMGPRLKGSFPRGFVDSPYKVYAGNLGWTVTSQSLRDAFSAQPGLLGAKVIYDRDSGRSRGYGFVSFASPQDAHFAIQAMNGEEVEGRPLRLNLAAERPSAASPNSQASAMETDPHGISLQSSLTTTTTTF